MASTFKDKARADAIKDRLQTLTNVDLSRFWEEAFSAPTDIDRAAVNLERWLMASSSPETHLAHLVEAPALARGLILLLGAGQSVANGLLQNPELAALVIDPAEIGRTPAFESILSEGRALLSASNSYSHSLDRLRFVKQRWRIPIILNDLEANWRPEQVWEALSVLADALLTLALEAAWAEYAKQKKLEFPCPLMVVGFGKLGGHELNYSSDVDLVYVLEDDLGEAAERHAFRFCEMYGRALADMMGRGALFRVDLRLRPFGSSGSIASTMKAIETYYRSHAESWETQALIRSRPICGLPALWPRWKGLVERQCFKENVSEQTISALAEMRERIERHADEEDLKRGPGGIRDVEFLVQLLQMLHGYRVPELRTAPTVDALLVLSEHHLIDGVVANTLRAGYTFLRQLEHRCQLMEDQQTHVLPSSEEGREHVAKLMGFGAWPGLQRHLEEVRAELRAIYSQVVPTGGERSVGKGAIGGMDAATRAALDKWFGSFPDAADYYRALSEDGAALARILRVIQVAPALQADLSSNVAVTEAIVNGEIEESPTALPPFDPGAPQGFARSARSQQVALAAGWALDTTRSLGEQLSGLNDRMLGGIANSIEAVFDVVALGSYGTFESNVGSDLDVVLICADNVPHELAETQAQKFLAAVSSLKRYGCPVDLDLRLRPEGGKGLLVRSYSGLKTYELERMEMWERFALGFARLVRGSEESLRVINQAAYAEPLTPEHLQELLAMKRRIETERVQPQYWKREVKLGYGGLSDIDWFVHLHEMRYPTTLEVGKQFTVPDRLRKMVKATLINSVEFEQLMSARRHLNQIRTSLTLLDYTKDILPENPDKLERLAQALGKANGYELQREHGVIIEQVRSIYLEGLQRLGG